MICLWRRDGCLKDKCLQVIVDAIENHLQSYTAGECSMDFCVSVISGHVRALRSIGIDISKRAQLNDASQSALFNVSRAGRSVESVDAIRQDSITTTEVLVHVIVGLIEVDDQSPLSHPEVVVETVRLIGMLAAWINKGKVDVSCLAKEDVSSLDGTDVTGVQTVGTLCSAFDAVGAAVLRYLQRGLNHPVSFRHAASALRSVCAQCGRHIASNPSYVDTLIAMWKDLCTADLTSLRVQIMDSVQDMEFTPDMAMGGNEETDILCEILNSFVQAIAMVLRHMVDVQSSLEYIRRIMHYPAEVLSQYAAGPLDTRDMGESPSSRDVIALVHSIATCVRSARVKGGINDYGNDGAGNGEGSGSIDKSLHPILQDGILQLSGDDVFGALGKVYGGDTFVCEALCYLYTSLMTFVAPLVPQYHLCEFSSCLLSYYVEPISEVARGGTCDFVMELLSIVGPTVQYHKSKMLYQSTYGSECSPQVLNGLEKLLVEAVNFSCRACMGVFQLMSAYISDECLCMVDLASSEWLQTRDIAAHEERLCRSDQMEHGFRVLRSVCDTVPFLWGNLEYATAAACSALLYLPNGFDNIALSHSASLFLKSMVSAVLSCVLCTR